MNQRSPRVWRCHHRYLMMHRLFVCVLVATLAAVDGSDMRVGPDITHIDGERVTAGTVIRLAAGERPTLSLEGLHGTHERPITVINDGGVVRVANSDRGFAIRIANCRHLRFSGSGTSGVTYGISAETRRRGMMAVHVVARSSFIEIDHVEITGAGFAGFNVKDETRADGSTNRGAFVMEGINLHHNLVRDVEGEGFYVGHTFYHGHKQADGTILLPHVLRGVRIHHNRIENSGCEGIQVGSTIDDLEITDNVIINPGQRPFAQWQDNGIQVNAAGRILVARNVIIGTPSNAIIGGPLEDEYHLRIERNLIVNVGGRVGYIGGGERGAGGRVEILHNTVVGSREGGWRIANHSLGQIVVANNLLAGLSGPAWQLPAAGAQRVVIERGNLVVPDAATAGLLHLTAIGEAMAGELAPGSPARGRGVALGDVAVGPDPRGRTWMAGQPIDVGAWASSLPLPTVTPRAPLKRQSRHRESGTEPLAPAPVVPEGWREQLVEALRARLAAGDQPTLVLRSGAAPLTIHAIGADGVLQLRGKGLAMGLPLDTIQPQQAAALAAQVQLPALAAALAASP